MKPAQPDTNNADKGLRNQMPPDQPQLIPLDTKPHSSPISQAISVANSEGYEAAIPLFETQVSAGDSVGNCYLGMIYEYGNIEDSSKFEFARFYYEQAVEDGWVPGLIGLGRLYYYGLGVQQDLARALEYFLTIDAAGVSSPIADYYLGQMYQLGEGIEVNFERAKYFFNRSANAGYQHSRLRLSMLAKQEKDYFGWISKRVSLYLATTYIVLKLGSTDWRIGLPTCTMGPSSTISDLSIVT